MEATVYLVTDVQSGDFYWTAYEPEVEPELFHVKEVPMSDAPKWALERLVAELNELE